MSISNELKRNTPVCIGLSLCLALVACGGGGGSGAPSPIGAAVVEKDLAASQPGELLTYLKAKLKTQLAEGSANKLSAGSSGITALSASSGSPLAANAASSTTSGQDSSALAFSSSTLQEEGVDEDDLMKTDGTMIYGMLPSSYYTAPAQLVAYRRDLFGGITKTAALNLSTTGVFSGMYLLSQAKKLAIVGSSSIQIPLVVDTTTTSTSSASSVPSTLPASVSTGTSSPPLIATSPPYYPTYAYKNKVDVSFLDTSSPSTLSINQSISIDGNLIGSRVIGTTLYLATSYYPQVGYTNAQIDALKPADVIPSIQIDKGTPIPLFAESDCYLQTKNAANGAVITTITAIDLSSPVLARNSRCFLGGSEAIYVSDRSVYVATTRYAYTGPTSSTGTATATWAYPYDIKTDIHKFSINGLSVKYKSSAEVKGHLGWQQDKKPYRMSELGDDLRVITFTGELGWTFAPAIDPSVTSVSQAAGVAPSPATLTILRDSNGELKAIGSLPNSKRPQPLGLANEQIYAVRFLGDKAFVVTFRRTDPLYTLDLSDPTDPKAVGELKTPGFSNYLFPVGTSLLLGVGQDATSNGFAQGVKIGLIDISDFAYPKEIATRIIGKRGSTSALDSGAHGINLYTVNDVTRVAIPIRVFETPTNNTFTTAPAYQSLFRFEVNAAAKTLVDKPSVLGSTFDVTNPWSTPGLYDVLDIAKNRSVQISDQVYYLNAGLVTGSKW
jgi:uncharacterized secreted protein with C-terminal beta-propeller domain